MTECKINLRRQHPRKSQQVALEDSSRQVRGRHMVRTLVEQVNSGERVFAVVGASHVIRQEPVLHKPLDSDSISSN